MRRVRITSSLLAVFVISVSGFPATVVHVRTTGVAIGNAVIDGRPIVWRNFDWEGNVTILYRNNARHAYIATSPKAPNHGAGTNEAGLATYSTLMRQMNPKGTPSYATPAMSWLLGSCASVAEVSQANGEQARFENGEEDCVQHWDASEKSPALSVSVIDAQGHAAIFELGRKSFFEYDLNARSRLDVQPIHIGVRANVRRDRQEVDVPPKVAAVARLQASDALVSVAKVGP